ncbi:MAG TPA: glycoside hydrolase family 15 protein [Mycobacteriales bacterium]|nr:glycoside hydrolase family 15 protein [Mycobacteriales bacterium]
MHRVVDVSAQYPPQVLREYSLIADGERGALIGSRGDIAWMCAPRWHDDAVFSTLIGGKGLYAVTPDVDRHVWGGYYEPGSLIWRSRWATSEGIVESRDALAFPGDPHRAVILRSVCAQDSATPMRAVLAAHDRFGAAALDDVRRRGGVWTARTGRLNLRWSGLDDVRRTALGYVTQRVVRPGEQWDLVLEISDRPFDDEPPEAREQWEVTANAWSSAKPDLGGTIAPVDAMTAFTVLRGLTAASGGMVAAATMALPERAEQGRNYDYRYVWIRDQCYAGQAAAAAGADIIVDDAVRFVSEQLLAHGPELKPAYTILGDEVPDERKLRGLDGYPGGSDIAGNRANVQFQLDSFGEALQLFAAAADCDRIETTNWHAVEAAADAIARRWKEPDNGIWEIDAQRWTHSRLMCVAGLRDVSRHAPGKQAAEWTSLADTILAQVASDSLHPSGRWQRSPEDENVDAALLLAGIRGAVAPDDPRTAATREAIRRDLCRDHFVYRFRQGPGPLEDAEGAFVLCGFLMAMADHAAGDHISAARFFERNRAACGPPGLFSEEYDVRQRQLRGNLPQAFVHAVMLEAAGRLAADAAGQ